MSAKEYIRDGRAPIPESEQISRVMSSIRHKNTKPELLLRKALWAEGLRGYRIHVKKMAGRPDIVYPKKKLAIFVNGCFWHRCPHCNLTLPKSNTEFWETKFSKNKERDQRKLDVLHQLGWNTLVIWECQIKKDLPDRIRQIKELL